MKLKFRPAFNWKSSIIRAYKRNQHKFSYEMRKYSNWLTVFLIRRPIIDQKRTIFESIVPFFSSFVYQSINWWDPIWQQVHHFGTETLKLIQFALLFLQTQRFAFPNGITNELIHFEWIGWRQSSISVSISNSVLSSLECSHRSRSKRFENNQHVAASIIHQHLKAIMMHCSALAWPALIIIRGKKHIHTHIQTSSN